MNSNVQEAARPVNPPKPEFPVGLPTLRAGELWSRRDVIARMGISENTWARLVDAGMKTTERGWTREVYVRAEELDRMLHTKPPKRPKRKRPPPPD